MRGSNGCLEAIQGEKSTSKISGTSPQETSSALYTALPISSLRRRSGITLTLRIPKACVPNVVIEDNSGQSEENEASDSEVTTSDDEAECIYSIRFSGENGSTKHRLTLGSPVSTWLHAIKGRFRPQTSRTPVATQFFDGVNFDGIPYSSKHACLSDNLSKANSKLILHDRSQ